MPEGQGERADGASPDVATLAAAADWSRSPLGPPESWPASLRTTARLLLRSKAEIVLFWGPEFVAIYNEAYAPTIGDKHPRALGRPARENWAELWNDLEPLLRGVRETGETYSAKDRPFYIERHGYGETVYFDISYSAVPEDDGSVGGVLCIVSETTERVLAARRVKESETRLSALVRATADVIFRMSPDWQEMRSLDGRGLLENTLTARTGWIDDYILAEDRPTFEERIAEAIAKMEPLQVEHRVRLIGGGTGWTATRAVPIIEDGAIVEWFGASSDITERRKAEEHLRLVVNELNHRVKNNLAMVQSIARQTFRDAANLQQAQERFSERLVALAQANDLLTGERWVGASLRGAIEQAVSPYQRDRARIRLVGPDITLTPKTALALTLAAHELSANAVKYGAWSNDRGVVTIEWSRYTGQRGQDRLRIDWSESDGPRVVPPGRRGFGSRLIERGLAGELEGTVELSFAEPGVRCVVDAPLAQREA